MADDAELSVTSDEETPTRQEKARRTCARNRAQEDAAAKQLSEETAGGRSAKRNALEKRASDIFPGNRPLTHSIFSMGHTTPASNTAEPKIAKKAKSPSTAGADTMDLGDQQPAKEKKSSKKTPAGKKTPKTKSGNEGFGKEPGTQKRSEDPGAKKRSVDRYLPNIIKDSDDDEPATQVSKPVVSVLSTSRLSAAAVMLTKKLSSKHCLFMHLPSLT
ncbi:hypothetical protein B0H13DRAFT_2289386 [Mycena leptocephala]|nr:hypothetical protein B0H13DRAFT_2289386 [Mycena leptocephala]